MSNLTAQIESFLDMVQKAQPLDKLQSIEIKASGPIQVHYARATITFSNPEQLEQFLNIPKQKSAA
jgi:hypothetical protein